MLTEADRGCLKSAVYAGYEVSEIPLSKTTYSECYGKHTQI